MLRENHDLFRGFLFAHRLNDGGLGMGFGVRDRAEFAVSGFPSNLVASRVALWHTSSLLDT